MKKLSSVRPNVPSIASEVATARPRQLSMPIAIFEIFVVNFAVNSSVDMPSSSTYTCGRPYFRVLSKPDNRLDNDEMVQRNMSPTPAAPKSNSIFMSSVCKALAIHDRCKEEKRRVDDLELQN
jgi:hypothetical protein